MAARTDVQTLVLSKERFESADAAKSWARENESSHGKVDETEESYRLRQAEPEEFKADSFRTIELTDGVKAVIGRRKESAVGLRVAPWGANNLYVESSGWSLAEAEAWARGASDDSIVRVKRDERRGIVVPANVRAAAEKEWDRRRRGFQSADAQRFAEFQAARGPDGHVRRGVWDRVCVPGIDEKDGLRTEFTLATLSRMAENFERRGEPVALDSNHQSQYTRENGQPAPALGFYGALAVVWGGQIARLATAKGVTATGAEPGLDLSRDGLWALRSDVTEEGDRLLPNFRYLSPTFTPRGVDRDGSQIGYHLLAVAATNTPWQPGTEITFAAAPREGASVGDAKYWLYDVASWGERVLVGWTDSAALARRWVAEDEAHRLWRDIDTNAIGGAGKPNVMEAPATPATERKMPKLSKLAKFVGLEGKPEAEDDEKVKQALATKIEAVAKKMAMDDEDEAAYEEEARQLDEAAETYEEAVTEEDGDKTLPSVMRRMAARFRRMAGPGAGAAGDDGAEKSKMARDEEEAKKMAARSFAQRLGVSLGANLTSAQMFDALHAAAVPAGKLPELIQAQVKMALEARDAVASRRESEARAALLADRAVAGGYPSDKRADLIRAASDPATYEACEAAVEPFVRSAAASNPTLFAQTVYAGAPVGAEARRPAALAGPDRRVVRNEIATFVEEGGRFSAMAIDMAESQDPAVRKKVDALLSESERSHAGLRLIAANRILKQERPDMWEAAESPSLVSL